MNLFRCIECGKIVKETGRYMHQRLVHNRVGVKGQELRDLYVFIPNVPEKEPDKDTIYIDKKLPIVEAKEKSNTDKVGDGSTYKEPAKEEQVELTKEELLGVKEEMKQADKEEQKTPLNCGSCGGEVSFGTPVCPFCKAELDWSRVEYGT